ncbi:MAG TPA: pitrilysin family protein [Longimicrobiales bacterium]|nr:pitrilysin family protein [Longimicrobiales bacterium]
MINRSQPPAPAAVRDFTFPEITRSELGNGLAILAAPQGTLPVVTLRLMVHAGAEHDTPRHAGLAQLTADVLEAGTATRSADRLAWAFELLGAELDVDIMWDYAALTVTVAADRVEAAMALLAEVVLEPALDPREIERLKNEQLAELLQRESDPRALASDQALRFIFSQDSPYHRPVPGLRESVRALSAEAVHTHYDNTWRADNAALMAVGAIDPATVFDLAARHLDGWSTGGQRVRPAIKSASRKVRFHLVHRAGSVQSEIRAGHVGVPRTHPDYYALTVANSILGGAFTSRLNMNLREKHGFTYGVRSGFGFRKQPGPFLIQTAVATDVTARAVEEIWRETTELLEHGPTADEMTAARDYLSGTVPLELQTTEQIAVRAGEIFVFDFPVDYFSLYRDELRRVSAEQAWQAARAHIRPDELVFTIVGDAETLETTIAALGLGTIEVQQTHD